MCYIICKGEFRNVPGGIKLKLPRESLEMREKEKESKHVIVEKAVEVAELDSSSAFHYARYFCCQRFCFLNYKTRIVGQI